MYETLAKLASSLRMSELEDDVPSEVEDEDFDEVGLPPDHAVKVSSKPASTCGN